MQLKNLVFANVLFMVIFSEITEMKYVKDRCSHSTAKSWIAQHSAAISATVAELLLLLRLFLKTVMKCDEQNYSYPNVKWILTQNSEKHCVFVLFCRAT